MDRQHHDLGAPLSLGMEPVELVDADTRPLLLRFNAAGIATLCRAIPSLSLRRRQVGADTFLRKCICS
jgi:hypothetical protein